jgi:hypothetical protein
MYRGNPQGSAETSISPRRPQRIERLDPMQAASALARLGLRCHAVFHATRSGRHADLSKGRRERSGAYVSLVWRLRKRLCMLTAMP